MRIQNRIEIGVQTAATAVEIAGKKVVSAAQEFRKKVTEATKQAFNTVFSSKRANELKGQVREIKNKSVRLVKDVVKSTNEKACAATKSVKEALGTVSSRIQETCCSTCKNVKKAAFEAINQIIPSKKEVRALQGRVQVLTNKAVHLAKDIVHTTQGKVASAAHSFLNAVTNATSCLCTTCNEAAQKAKRVVSECLDSMIPSRKEARALRQQVRTLNGQLQNANNRSRQFAQLAHTQRVRAEKAENEKKNAENLGKGFAQSAEEQKKRVEQLQIAVANAQNLAKGFAQSTEEQKKRVEQLQIAVANAQNLAKGFSKAAEKEKQNATVNGLSYKVAIRKLIAAQEEIEGLKEELAAIQLSLEPQAAPADDHLEAPEEHPEDPADELGPELPEREDVDSSSEDKREVASHDDKKPAARRHLSNNLPTPSKKVYMQGLVRRKHR